MKRATQTIANGLVALCLVACSQAETQQEKLFKLTLKQMVEGDANADGYVTTAEVKTIREKEFVVLSRNGSEIDPETMPAPPRIKAMMLRNMDKDGDGKLSKVEFVNGLPPIWSRMDTNGDNRISRSEVAAMRERGIGG
jgi:hypothetical protein